jgi:hypothetical protein
MLRSFPASTRKCLPRAAANYLRREQIFADTRQKQAESAMESPPGVGVVDGGK